MDKTTWVILGLEAYAVLFLTCVFAYSTFRRRKRKERPPVEFKLLRGPGETLRRRVEKAGEDFVIKLAALAVAPPVAASLVITVCARLSPKTALFNLLAGAAVLVAGIVLVAKLILRLEGRRRDDLLGYLGERAVAEALQPLPAEDYRIFHDLPVKEGDRTFNLDHVVVGPTGLFAVETKTRRKGRARPGFKDYEVTYDGKQLIWPWTEDTFGLDQADAEARWLTKWIHKMTGLSVTARPILALPGWFVVNRVYGPILVANHKNLPSFIRGHGERVLADDQIDLIARQIDAQCRDVED